MIEEMITAAHDAGDQLRSLPRPARANTLEEFMSAFATVESAVEPTMRKHLEELRPGVEWAEELNPVLPAGELRWVVDIADGAVQYLQGLPQWCVSVTLVDDGEAVAAVLYNPNLGETYSAAAGQGAFLNGERITPSTKTDLTISLVGTSQPPFAGSQPDAAVLAGRSLGAIVGAVGAVRNLGPTSWQVADVASGRMDAFWEYGHDDGNLLGAALIAREAGVLVTTTEGAPWQAGSVSFLAAPTDLHAALSALLHTACGSDSGDLSYT
jgi:myo-inositol-1(or 4)-monophosphatase